MDSSSSSTAAALPVPAYFPGDTKLHGLVSYAYISDDILFTLVQKNPSLVNQTNEAGQIPLHLAIQCAYFYGITTLLQYGSDVLIADFKGRRVIHIAAMLPTYSTDTITLLLDHIQRYQNSPSVSIAVTPSQYVQSTDYEGYTPLHYASAVGNNDTVYLLLQYNRNLVNQRCHSGDTALHLALGGLHLSTIKLLLMNNASLTIPASDGRNAIDMATSSGSKSIIKLVNKFAANQNGPPSSSAGVTSSSNNIFSATLKNNLYNTNTNGIHPPLLPNRTNVSPYSYSTSASPLPLLPPSYSPLSPYHYSYTVPYTSINNYYSAATTTTAAVPGERIPVPPMYPPPRSSPPPNTAIYGPYSSSPQPPSYPRSSPPLLASSSSSPVGAYAYSTPTKSVYPNNINNVLSMNTSYSPLASSPPYGTSSTGALEGLLSLVRTNRANISSSTSNLLTTTTTNTTSVYDEPSVTSSSSSSSTLRTSPMNKYGSSSSTTGTSTSISNVNTGILDDIGDSVSVNAYSHNTYTDSDNYNGNYYTSNNSSSTKNNPRFGSNESSLKDTYESYGTTGNSVTSKNEISTNDYAYTSSNMASNTLRSSSNLSSSSNTASFHDRDTPHLLPNTNSPHHQFYSPLPSASPLLMGQSKLPGDTNTYLGYPTANDGTTSSTATTNNNNSNASLRNDHQAALRSASTPLPRPGSQSSASSSSSSVHLPTESLSTNETINEEGYPMFTIPPQGTFTRPIPTRSPRENRSIGGGSIFTFNDTLTDSYINTNTNSNALLSSSSSTIPPPPSALSHGAFSTPQASPRTSQPSSSISHSTNNNNNNAVPLHFAEEFVNLSSQELVHLIFTYRQRIQSLEQELIVVKKNENLLQRQLQTILPAHVTTTPSLSNTTEIRDNDIQLNPVVESSAPADKGQIDPLLSSKENNNDEIAQATYGDNQQRNDNDDVADNDDDDDDDDDDDQFEEASAGSILEEGESLTPYNDRYVNDDTDNTALSNKDKDNPLLSSTEVPVNSSLPDSTTTRRSVFVYTLPPPSPATLPSKPDTASVSNSNIGATASSSSSSSILTSTTIERAPLQITNRHLAVWAKFFENATRMSLQESLGTDSNESPVERVASPVPENPLPLAISILTNNLPLVEQLIVKGACSNRTNPIQLSSSSPSSNPVTATTTITEDNTPRFAYPYPSSSLGPPFPCNPVPLDGFSPLIIQTSPIHVAAAVVCNVHILSVLVDGAEDSNLDITDEFGNTPLISALFTSLERIHALHKYIDDNHSKIVIISTDNDRTIEPDNTTPVVSSSLSTNPVTFDMEQYRTMIMNYHIPLIHNVLHCVKFLLESAVSTTLVNKHGIGCLHILSFINAIILKETITSSTTNISSTEMTDEIKDNVSLSNDTNALSMYRTLSLTKYRETQELLQLYVM